MSGPYWRGRYFDPEFGELRPVQIHARCGRLVLEGAYRDGRTIVYDDNQSTHSLQWAGSTTAGPHVCPEQGSL